MQVLRTSIRNGGNKVPRRDFLEPYPGTVPGNVGPERIRVVLKAAGFHPETYCPAGREDPKVAYVDIIVYPIERQRAVNFSRACPERVSCQRPVMAVAGRIGGYSAGALIKFPITY